MIYKVLEKAIYQIEEYQRRYPDHYRIASQDIDSFKIAIAAMRDKMTSGPDHYLIDPSIRKLIEDLNDAGYDTFSSCQGKRCIEDFECDSHNDFAFVSFCHLPRRISRRASDYGLRVYNRGLSLAPFQKNGDPDAFMKSNGEFEQRMRLLFDLPGHPVEVSIVKSSQ